MKNYNKGIISLLAVIFTASLFFSCSRDTDELEEATYPTTPEIFIDGFSAGLEYDAFGTSKVTAFDVDTKVKYKGSASMRFDVPDSDDPKGGFAAGIFTTEDGRDLSGYNVLTFWARASQSSTVDELGFGLTFDEEEYRASIKEVSVSTKWEKYFIPIPDAAKLKNEKGLFYYVDAPENGTGYSFWVDEVKYENIGTLAYAQPQILNGNDQEESAVNGSSITIDGLSVSTNLPNGINQEVEVTPAYFEFNSSANNVATVDESGVVTVLSSGTSIITASIAGAEAEGSLTITSAGAFVHAPIPTVDPANVISIFSNAYTNAPVEYYNGFWAPFQTTLSADFTVNGDDVLNYTNLNFVGIQFTSPTINAANMTHLHVDIWIPNTVDPAAQLAIKVVDLGPDGAFGDPDPSTSITLSSPDPLVSQSWISLDISIESLASKDKLAQIIFENLDSPLSGFYADNIYFYSEGGEGPTEPTESAPDPTQDAANVISVFSDAYSNIEGTNLNPGWGQATVVSEVSISGNNTMMYAGLNFQGIELGSSQDVSGMDFLHLDVWTANSTALNAFLISNGPVEAAKALNVPTSGWMSVDIPLGDFSPVDLVDIIQFKFDGNGDIYLDNIYFYSEGGEEPAEPTEPAPDPSQDAANVISVFSDAYSNIEGTNLNPGWGQATVVSEVSISGNNTMMYAGLNFQGIELGSSQDVSGMDFLHMDVWTTNSTALNAFLISNGPVEAAKALNVPTSGWMSVDIPLGDFSPVDLADIIQFKFDGNGDIYLDNIYFYNEGGEEPSEPTEPAPDPSQDAANVISVFSDAYSNIEGTNLNPGWGQATVVSEVSISGNNTMMYAGLNFQGIELGSSQDVSGMDFLHLDVWTANSTALNAFLISNGPVEAAKALNVPTSGWMSVDIPLGDFSPVDLADIIQFKFDGNGDIYLDNIYFYSEGGEEPSEPTEPAPDPSQDATNVISVFSDAYTNIAGTNLNPGWGQATVVSEVSISGNNTMMYAGLNFQGIELGSSQDVTGMDFLHMDIWTANSTALNAFLISNGPVEAAKALNVPTSGWMSVDIPLGDFSPVDLADIIQFKFDGNGDIYLDNIYFYSEGGEEPSEPTEPAPDPSQDAANVISVFSDAYSNIAGTNLNPGWGQATVFSEVSIGGNNTMMYAGLNYQGIELGSSQNVSGMDFLHLDVWTTNSTALNAFLISNGPVEAAIALNVPTSGWMSVDIPLGDFSPVDLADVIQFKFDGNGDIYLDNIYFYSESGSGPEPSLPLTFENGETLIAFDGGATASNIDNPDMNGNTSAKVLEFNKVVGSAWYSGVVFDENLRTTPIIDLANGTIFTIKIWSPKAGVTVRFQLEGGAAPAYEVFQVVNNANQWETLTFDFTSQVNTADTYPRFSIFPDFDASNQVPVATEAIYYIDDISQQ